MSRDVLTTVASRFLLVGLGLVMTVFTSRWLGPAARGDYAVILALASLVVQLGHLGLGSTGTYQLASDPRTFARLSANSLWISFVWGSVVAAGVIGTSYLFGIWSGLPASYLCMGGLLGLPLMFLMLGGNLLVGLEHISLYNLFQVFQGVLLAAASGVAWYLVGSVSSFLIAAVVAAWLAATVMGLALVRLGGCFGRFDWPIFRSGLLYSAKSYVICLLGFLIVRMNLFAVECWSPPEEAGYLSLAIQGAEVLLILPVSLGTVLFPRLVRDQSRRRQLTLRNALRTGGLMALACLIATGLSRPVIQLVFGTPYLPAAPALNWMMPGVFAASLLSVVSQYLSALGVPKSQVVIWFIGLAVSSLTLWLEVPARGAVGGAMAYSLSMCTVCLLACGIAFSLSRQPAMPQQPLALRRAA